MEPEYINKEKRDKEIERDDTAQELELGKEHAEFTGTGKTGIDDGG